MRDPVRDGSFPVLGRMVALGLLGAGLSFVALMSSAAFAGAGHGSALPMRMFMGPLGIGLLVWPTCFALMGVQRRHIAAALAGAAALIVLHALTAWAAYALDAHRSSLDAMWAKSHIRDDLLRFSAVVMGVALVSPVCLAIRLMVAGRSGSVRGE